MHKIDTLLRQFIADDSGVTAIEYGLIAALIAVTIIGTVTAVGTGLNNTFTTVQTELDAASGTGT